MKALFASTAIVLAGLGPVSAQTAPAAEAIPVEPGHLVDAEIYAADATYDPTLGRLPDATPLGRVAGFADPRAEGIVVETADGLVVLPAGAFVAMGDGGVTSLVLRDADAVLPVAEAYDSDVVTVSELEAGFGEMEAFGLGRAAGAIAADNEGSGMTTQSSPRTETRATATTTGGMSDGLPEGTTTNIPDLDDGTVVANPRTPATIRIEDGRVVASMDRDLPEGTAPEAVVATADDAPQALTDGQGGTPVNDLAEGPVTDADGDVALQYDNLSLPQLEGIDVYDATDERIGEIGYTVNATASGLGHPLAILDIGGFLGLGAHNVAMPLPEIELIEGEDGLRAYVDATREELEAMPEYDG